MRPCSAQAARYSPFSVTFACVHVRPDRYQTTGSLASRSAWGGRKIEKVMSVEVALDACFTTSCRPPCDLFSETVSKVTAAVGEVRTACQTHSRDSRADPRRRCRRPPRPDDATHRLARGCRS